MQDGKPLPCKQEVKGKKSHKKSHNDNVLDAENRLESVDKLNNMFGARNFCAFMAPYENDQQLAELYYAGRVDLIVSKDTDMLVYGLPMAFDFSNSACSYFPPNAFARAASDMKMSVEDFLVDTIQTRGCDYFKTRSQKMLLNEVQPNASVHRPNCAGLFRDLIQALYQFFYQPVFCTESGRVESLCPVPTLERKLRTFLPDTVFGEFDLPNYSPVSKKYVPWLQAKLLAAPMSPYLPIWPYKSDSIFEAFDIWALNGDISYVKFRGCETRICWTKKTLGAYAAAP